MNTELLKKKILQLAMQGKLVEQDESDGTAEELIDQILEEKKKLMAEGKIKKEKLSRIYKNPTDNHYYEKFDDGKEKDITEQIPYELPANWCWSRIGVLEEINLGFTYRPHYTEKGIYFLSVKDISGGKIDFSKAQKVSEETYKNAAYGSKPQKGDILFGRVGTIGKPQIINDETPFCIFVSLGFFRDHLNLINKKYICSWMESNLFNEQVQLNVKGTAQINLNTGWLKGFYIPVPPLKEQNKISLKIEALNKQIEFINISYSKVNKLRDLLKNKIIDMSIKGQLTKQLSTDEPSSKLIEKIVDKKHKLMAEGKIKKENLSIIYKDSDNQFYEKFDDGKIVNVTKEIPFDIPNNWIWTKYKNICIISSARRVHKSDWKSDGIPFYRAREIAKLSEQGYVDNKLFISNELYNKFSKSGVPKENDIMITAVGTLGKCYIVKSKDKFYYKDASVICFENRFNLNPNYIVNYMNSNIMKKQIKNDSSGTTVDTLTMVKMNEYYIPIPPIGEQNRIVFQINQLFNILE